MNIIKATRSALDMTQPEFSAWLSKKIDRSKPFPAPRISEWENETRSPRKNVRDVCMPIVAGEIASDAVLQVSEVFKSHGVDVLEIAMSDEMKVVCKKIKERIIDETK